MTATHNVHSITHGPRLHLAFELSWNQAILRWLTARQAKPPVPERRGRRDPEEGEEPS